MWDNNGSWYLHTFGPHYFPLHCLGYLHDSLQVEKHLFQIPWQLPFVLCRKYNLSLSLLVSIPYLHKIFIQLTDLMLTYHLHASFSLVVMTLDINCTKLDRCLITFSFGLSIFKMFVLVTLLLKISIYTSKLWEFKLTIYIYLWKASMHPLLYILTSSHVRLMEWI